MKTSFFTTLTKEQFLYSFCRFVKYTYIVTRIQYSIEGGRRRRRAGVQRAGGGRDT